jgi:hypothetical protein
MSGATAKKILSIMFPAYPRWRNRSNDRECRQSIRGVIWRDPPTAQVTTSLLSCRTEGGIKICGLVFAAVLRPHLHFPRFHPAISLSRREYGSVCLRPPHRLKEQDHVHAKTSRG